MTRARRSLVVDASVVVKLFVQEDFSDRADFLFAAGQDRGNLRAPDLLYSECANIVWKHVRKGALDPVSAAAHMDAILALHLTATPTKELAALALAVAVEHDISAYDACYVALAQSLACDLITADQRLVNRLSLTLPFVRWLGDTEFEPGGG